MHRLFNKMALAIGLLIAVWGLGRLRPGGEDAWRHTPGAPAQVRILRFYATAGVLITGEKAQLCYGVENARSVRISPPLSGVYPSTSHCLEVGPEHTTHYTILAEGFDGRVAMQSLTLPVESMPPAPVQQREYAALLPQHNEPYPQAQ